MVKMEWPSVRFFIPRGNPVDTHSESIPWAWDMDEIWKKAFLLRDNASSKDDGRGRYYVFQDRKGNACWTPYNNGRPSYEQRRVGLKPDLGMSIAIYDDHVDLLKPPFREE